MIIHAAQPAIASVKDSKNQPVPHASSTVDTNLMVAGTGEPSSILYVFDGNTALMPPVSVTHVGEWIFPATALTLGTHDFNARTIDGSQTSNHWQITVQAVPVLDLIPPRVNEVSAPEGNYLKISDFYESDFVTVIVPQFTGMAVGQSIYVSWSGRVVHESSPRNVTSLGPLEFRIPRIEVVDNIGLITPITYKVRPVGETGYETSDALNLRIESQPIPLPEPRINSENSVVTLQYPDMSPGHTGRVRWIGIASHDTPVQLLDTRPEEYDIPLAWVNENRGKQVLINYTVQLSSDGRLLFSQVLRKAIS